MLSTYPHKLIAVYWRSTPWTHAIESCLSFILIPRFCWCRQLIISHFLIFQSKRLCLSSWNLMSNLPSKLNSFPTHFVEPMIESEANNYNKWNFIWKHFLNSFMTNILETPMFFCPRNIKHWRRQWKGKDWLKRLINKDLKYEMGNIWLCEDTR